MSVQRESGSADPTAPMSALRDAPIFAEIDKAGKPNISEAPEPQPEVPVVDAKKEEAVLDKPVEDKPDKPVESPAEVPAEKMAPKQLRDAYEKLKTELREIKAKPATATTTTPNLLEVPEFKEVQAKLTIKEKEAAEAIALAKGMEEKVQRLDYEQSTEFQEKYRKPYVDAWKRGRDEIAKLTVPSNDGGPGRKANFDDLGAIVSEPDMEKALQMAEDLFQNPTKANYALGLREKIIEAANIQDRAKEEFKARSTEIAQQKLAQDQVAQKQQVELWSGEIKAWAEKNPTLTKAAEGDAKAAELIEIGTKAADMAFGDTSTMSPQQRAKLYAETRNRAAHYGHAIHQRDLALKQVESLNAELSKYKTSAPGKGAVPADDRKPVRSVTDMIDALGRG